MIRILGAALLLATSSLTAQADDLVFVLKNQTSSVLAEFYASPANLDDWEEDILGTDTLEAGTQGSVTIRDGRRTCNYDMKFVFDDDEEVIEKGIDLCETGEYTLTD